MLSGPIPSTRVSGHSVPHSAQTGAQYGSPLKRPSIAWSLPDAVASDVTSIALMRIAIASPTSAPSTATGCATSWPPRIDGVIIGPQQPGVVLTTMWPPLATGPSIVTSGPSSPSVKVSTNTVWRAVRVSSVAISGPSGNRYEQGDFVAVVEHIIARRVGAVDDGQHRGQRRLQPGLLGGQALEQLRDRGAVVELQREHRRRRETAQPGTQSDADAHDRHNRRMAESLRGKLILASPVL